MLTDKIIIYTSILNGYDELVNPKVVNPKYKYVCITDDKKVTDGTIWEPIEFKQDIKDPARLNRYHKIMPHKIFPEYDVSLYIDGRIIILNDLEELIGKYQDSAKIVFRKHPSRKCLYQEASYCILKRLDMSSLIRKQIVSYKQNKYPRNNGLAAGGIILRRHNDPTVISTMETWWDELKKFSKRDQISLNYVLWKKKLSFSYFDGILLEKSLLIGSHKV